MEKVFDVVVIGGGHAGICAAIAAAEDGHSVVLIQDRYVLGGNSSSECGVPAHGAEALGHNRNLRDTGILEDIRIDFYCNYARHSDIPGYWEMLLYDRCAKTANLTLMMNTKMVAVTKSGRNIVSINVLSLNDSNFETIRGKYFIDGTGDGVLGFLAGAEFRMGREGRDEFGEIYLGQEHPDSHTLGSSIYGWAVKRDYDVPFTPPKWAVKYDDCNSLEHRPHNITHMIPRVTCSEDHRELMFFWWLEWGGELDVIKDNDKIYRHLLAELFGLWDHLKNHCDEQTRSALKNYELHRWSAFPLRRESRRIMGDYILTENDVAESRIFDDEIGYGGWPMDDHPPMGIASKDPACNQLFISHPYSIPYRCCYSKDFDNLFMVGRCMSVTHAALSSVRVMNTLGSIGEAVGLAAGMCVEHGVSARELGNRHISELQQRILNRDLFLLGKKEAAGQNIAENASIIVSSEAFIEKVDERIGSICLKYDTAVQIPISSSYIEKLAVTLEGECSSRIGWQVWTGSRLGYFGSNMIAEGSLDILGGVHEYLLDFDRLDIGYGHILTLVLLKNSCVSWVYGEEIYQTRWGVSYPGKMEGAAFHGASYVVNDDKPWIWINNHGRLPAGLSEWLNGLPGYKRHSKLFVTPCFSISPVQYPYGAPNLVNGVYRSFDWPNIWISRSCLPQDACLTWAEPMQVGKVEIIFDTNLDYSDQRYGFPRGTDDYSIPETIKETVRDYQVELFNDIGKSIKVWNVSGNKYRRNVLTLTEPVQNVTKLKLTVLATNGVEEARVFGIKVFG